MCAQCFSGATGAVAAVGSAAGLRAWLGVMARRSTSRLSPRFVRAATLTLLLVALVGSSATLSGTGAS